MSMEMIAGVRSLKRSASAMLLVASIIFMIGILANTLRPTQATDQSADITARVGGGSVSLTFSNAGGCTNFNLATST
ncbi:hypothetical protein FWC63_00900, partial [Candidatus Saccharibacteria bacterium]|nr:hypothetical protein [Candidatus Saccharibacteria bacterium]